MPTTTTQQPPQRRLKVWRTRRNSNSSSKNNASRPAKELLYHLPTLREDVEDLVAKPVVFRREDSAGTTVSSNSEFTNYSDDTDDERTLHGLSLLEEREGSFLEGSFSEEREV
ncbi:hypothetical protein ACA910_000323 [Epithemia clementina (nom. ined.)]